MDASNGLIYGLAKVTFGSQVIGWIDENGLQWAGTNPTTLPIKAAQIPSGPVDTIVTDAGTVAYTFNLIQLQADGLVNVIGGTKGAEDGSWVPPAVMRKTGEMTVETVSGHQILLPKATVTSNGQNNGINMQGVLAFGFRVDTAYDDTIEGVYKIIPPQSEP